MLLNAISANIVCLPESVAPLLRAFLMGAEVAYHDPFAPKVTVGETSYEAVPWDDPAAALDGFDAAVICTDHTAYDAATIVAAARLVIDCRGVTRGVEAPPGRVVRL